MNTAATMAGATLVSSEFICLLCELVVVHSMLLCLCEQKVKDAGIFRGTSTIVAIGKGN